MQVTFLGSEPIAENIASFNFKPPAPLVYTAGQFIELTIPQDNPDERGSQDRYALSVDVQVAPHLQGTNLSMLRRPGTTSLS